jgi:hypothetical protein
VLKAIEHDILRVEVLETTLAKAMAALQPSVVTHPTGRPCCGKRPGRHVAHCKAS